jgi:hypothetical protein
VPCDDERCWAWSINWHPGRPLREVELADYRAGLGIHSALIPGTWRPQANADNNYLIDREAQRTKRSYTGISGISEQDMACQESMGPIYDRTSEHLGTSDAAVIQMRRLLLKLAQGLEAGREPLPAQRPEAYSVRSTSLLLPRDADWTTEARASAAVR